MKAYLGLGSNRGDRRKLLADAVIALGDRGVKIVRESSVYETQPVGGPPKQQWFYNQVIEVEFDGRLRALFGICQRVERLLGRDHSREVQWGPRPIDIDLLLADEASDDPDLRVPHPRAHERRFVLEPLAELSPDLEIPGHGGVLQLLRALPGEPAVRVAP